MANYSEKLKDPRWQKKRLEILKRDKFRCRFCGNETETLHVHHLEYVDYYKEPWDYSNALLMTLCKTCHQNYNAEFKISAQVVLNKILIISGLTYNQLRLDNNKAIAGCPKSKALKAFKEFLFNTLK